MGSWSCKIVVLVVKKKLVCKAIFFVIQVTRVLSKVFTLEGHTYGAAFFAWSPNDKYLAVVAPDDAPDLWVWDIEVLVHGINWLIWLLYAPSFRPKVCWKSAYLTRPMMDCPVSLGIGTAKNSSVEEPKANFTTV